MSVEPVFDRLKNGVPVRPDPPAPESPASERQIKIVQQPMLAVDDQGVIPARHFEVTKLGLYMDDEATEKDWKNVGTALFQLEQSMQLVIGDWLNYGTNFGFTVEDIAKSLSRDIDTLKNWQRVASAFPETLRRVGLFYGHYSLLAARPLELKKLAVDYASEHGATVAELRTYLVQFKTARKASVKKKTKLVNLRELRRLRNASIEERTEGVRQLRSALLELDL